MDKAMWNLFWLRIPTLYLNAQITTTVLKDALLQIMHFHDGMTSTLIIKGM